MGDEVEQLKQVSVEDGRPRAWSVRGGNKAALPPYVLPASAEVGGREHVESCRKKKNDR